ncbi:hypothetical protein SADUNF_Sadunf13G0028700 [Salix dunnii]|uniref:Uncharacterized protein n=1 Tax=Salix dunnii TaxID=1413687 RepID=A0A835MLH8_9ROSI|nr:hypothetical protein SADUNF_Sadunf13G0028700 [Salix dunnii]
MATYGSKAQCSWCTFGFQGKQRFRGDSGMPCLVLSMEAPRMETQKTKIHLKVEVLHIKIFVSLVN